MSWTWAETEREWLDGSQIAMRPEDVAHEFDTVERVLGGDWIESIRTGPGGAWRHWGTTPTLTVAIMGQRLASLNGAVGADSLIRRLCQREPAAYVELTAIHLIKSQRRDAVIEIAPLIRVADTERVPDFRTLVPGSDWTYVEVTRPDASQAEERVRVVLQRLIGAVKEIKKSFTLEVFLRREPTDQEVTAIARRIPEFCHLDGRREDDMGAVGLLLLNYAQPGQMIVGTPRGEPVKPCLCASHAVVGGSEPARHVVVRIPFTDERPDDFLRREARQLPKVSPGLLMLEHRELHEWAAKLNARLQPRIHTRVSGIFLWTAAFHPTSDSVAWLTIGKILVNRHARLPLPDWIAQALRHYPPDFLAPVAPS